MSSSPADPFTLLQEAFDLTSAALRRTEDPGERAAALAAALRPLWPAAPFGACRLRAGGQDHVRVVAEAGRPAPAAAPGADFPPALPAGLRWVVQEIPSRAVPGALALALPEGAGPEAEAPPRQLLGAYARELALLLDLDARQRERAGLERALAEQSWGANLGALASPITHEFNNFLNVVLLQVAVLEQDLPEKRRGEFTVIRQQGKSVAELVRQWQQYRYRQQPAPQPVEVNAVVRRAAEALAREQPAFGELGIALAPPGDAGPPPPGKNAVWLRLDLAAGLPPVSGTEVDLQRLVRFLVLNAAAAIPTLPALVTVRTEQAEGKVVVRVEDNGPAVAPEMLSQLFEPLASAREGPNRLELATCKTLAHRRLQGSIYAENRPEGGLAAVVSLRPWG
jgi:signal transduction histidine kinase